jgi:polyhydroxybutyrate depolymerase
MRTIGALSIGLILLLVAGNGACTRSNAKARSNQLVSKSLIHDGIVRTYHVYVPASLKRKKSLPLVIALHGGGGSGTKMPRFHNFTEHADRNGFVIVFPDGLDKHWNDGRGVAKYRAHRENIDDVGFISALIGNLIDDYPIDAGRVYVTGASNGGMMSNRLGCELSHKITAIAPVIATMAENISTQCSPTKPLPVLIMNGTEDKLVPWEGGHVRFGRRRLGKIISVQATVDLWRKQNECRSEPHTTWEKDRDPDDGTRIRKTVYNHCRDDVQVVLYEIRGGGHTWPGGRQYLPESFIGKTSRDMDGMEVIWKFFKQYRRQDR